MAQETKLNTREILLKIARLQEEIDNIKFHLKLEDNDLISEISDWEKTSLKDTSNFLKKHNL